MTFLKVSKLTKAIDGSKVLKNISFTQQRLQKVAVAGETGSGKSTLLKSIAGIVQPDSGSIWIEGEKVLGPEEKLVPGHPSVAYMSQHFELQKFLKVEQVLSYANKLSPEEAGFIYDICQIDHLLERKTDQLSGGERQRIALAKLLITSPRLLLLDEPYSNLDFIHKSTLKAVVNDISDKLGITCILVSHDPSDSLSWADDMLLLKNGKLMQKGTPEEVYNKPVDEYAAGLLGNYNLLEREEAINVFGLPDTIPWEHIIVRPENFMINSENNGIQGVVTKIYFFGSYREVEVSTERLKVIVRIGQESITLGDELHIAVGADNISGF